MSSQSGGFVPINFKKFAKACFLWVLNSHQICVYEYITSGDRVVIATFWLAMSTMLNLYRDSLNNYVLLLKGI